MTNRKWLESLTDEELAEALMGSFQIYLRVLRETGEMDETSHIKWLKAEHKAGTHPQTHSPT